VTLHLCSQSNNAQHTTSGPSVRTPIGLSVVVLIGFAQLSNCAKKLPPPVDHSIHTDEAKKDAQEQCIKGDLPSCIDRCMAKVQSACEKACEKGSPSGCRSLGQLHIELGQKPEARRSFDLALRIYETRCRAQSSELAACTDGAELILQIEENKSVSEKKALSLYEHACTQSHAPSCNAAGDLFVSTQVKRAKSFYSKACGLGHAQACDTFKKLK
jgi:TPR repeat protein